MRVGQSAETFYYLFRYFPERAARPIPEITGRDLRPSPVKANISSTGQGNVVLLGFTDEGLRRFHQITRAEALRGRARADAAGQGASSSLDVVLEFAQHFAIVLDGELESTPYIDYKQNPDGIRVRAGAEISNIQSYREAKDLAIELQSGALPFRIVVVR